MQLKVVRTGGRTGVDQGALVAARKRGIRTSGWVLPGWLLKHPALKVYGLKECSEEGFAASAKRNLESVDGALVLAGVFQSPDTQLVMSLCRELVKPYYPVSFRVEIESASVAEWLRQCGVRKLYVAGNRESVYPGAARATIQFLLAVFAEFSH